MTLSYASSYCLTPSGRLQRIGRVRSEAAALPWQASGACQGPRLTKALWFWLPAVGLGAVFDSGSGEGLPELDTVAFGIPDPREVTVGVTFPFWVDADARCGQLIEELGQVVDAEVHHEGLGSVTEVGRVEGEGGEDRHSGGFGAVEPQRAAVLGWDAEVSCIPGSKGLGVTGLEKNASDSGRFSQN